MSNKQPCAVCTEPGTLRCSRCKSMFFCGSEHQALLWSAHKVICTPNAPLVFKQRPLAFAELLEWATSKLTRDTLTDRGEGNTSPYQIALQCANALANGPADDHLNLSNTILQQNLHNAYHQPSSTVPKVEAFSLLSFLVYLLNAAGLHTSPPMNVEEPSFDFVMAEKLDPSTRNTFYLQALVMCTLVEKEASPDVITLARKRLLAIIPAEHEHAAIFAKGIEDFYRTASEWGWERRMRP
ncbi:hypothetical protein RQP46_003288 [Phenoliferia psychrophenolica]